MSGHMTHPEEMVFVSVSPRKNVNHFIIWPSVCNYLIKVTYPKLPDLS